MDKISRSILIGVARGTACMLVACLLAGAGGMAQQNPSQSRPATITSVLDSQLTMVEREIVAAADAMPEDKYSFSPTNGNFKGVRTFSEQVRHVATANNTYFGPILGQTVAPGAGGEGAGSNGPDSIKTKAQIMQYLRDSFALGHKAIATINADNAFTSSGKPGERSPAASAIFACVHAMDHYGQMVEYLRDNGIVPPASVNRKSEGTGGR